MRMRYLIFLGLLMLVLSWVTGYQRPSVGQDGAEPAPIAEGTHFIKPQKVVVLSAQVDGVVAQAYHEPQEFVHQGDILVQLDSKLIEIEIEQLKNQINLNTGKEEAAIVLEYSKSNLDIITELYDKKVGSVRIGSPKELHDARQRYELAQLGARKAQLEIAELQSNLQKSFVLLDKHVIRAPWDGVIVPFSSVKNAPRVENAKQVEVAETVRAGEPVQAMMKVDRLLISLPLPQERLNTVRLGQKAKIMVQGYPDESIPAQVVFISPTIASTGQFNLEVEFANPPLEEKNAPPGFYCYKFRPGMRAQVQWVQDE